MGSGKAGESRQALEEALLSAKGPGSKEITLFSWGVVNIPRNDAATLSGLIWFLSNPSVEKCLFQPLKKWSLKTKNKKRDLVGKKAKYFLFMFFGVNGWRLYSCRASLVFVSNRRTMFS